MLTGNETNSLFLTVDKTPKVEGPQQKLISTCHRAHQGLHWTKFTVVALLSEETNGQVEIQKSSSKDFIGPPEVLGL